MIFRARPDPDGVQLPKPTKQHKLPERDVEQLQLPSIRFIIPIGVRCHRAANTLPRCMVVRI